MNLYHFDMPAYLFRRGGWENREVVEAYANYAKKAFRAFGKEIRCWFTFNEPIVEPDQRYQNSVWYPCLHNFNRAKAVQYNISIAHSLAVAAYRRAKADGCMLDDSRIGLIMMPQAVTATLGNILVATNATDKLAESISVNVSDLSVKLADGYALTGVEASGVLSTSCTGTNGLFGAIIVGLLAVTLFIKLSGVEKLKVNLGEGVPPAVAELPKGYRNRTVHVLRKGIAMKNILLACNAGMSTSLLVQKMQAEAKGQGLDVSIAAYPLNKALEHVDTADVLLLGPQIAYAKKILADALKLMGE